MSNLIRAELYRIRRQPRFLAGLLALLLLGVGLTGLSLAVTAPWDSPVLFREISWTLSVGMLFAMACAGAASSETVKGAVLANEAVFGIPRWKMYLSRLAAALLTGLLLVGVLLAALILLALLFPAERAGLPRTLPRFLVLVWAALPLWCASAGLYLCGKLLLRSTALATSLQLSYYFLLWPVLGVLSLTEGSSPALGAAAWLYRLHPMTPFWNGEMLAAGFHSSATAAASVLDLTSFQGAHLISCWALGLGWLLVTSLVGILALRRRELR